MKRVDEGIDPHNIIITLFVGEVSVPSRKNTLLWYGVLEYFH